MLKWKHESDIDRYAVVATWERAKLIVSLESPHVRKKLVKLKTICSLKPLFEAYPKLDLEYKFEKCSSFGVEVARNINPFILLHEDIPYEVAEELFSFYNLQCSYKLQAHGLVLGMLYAARNRNCVFITQEEVHAAFEAHDIELGYLDGVTEINPYGSYLTDHGLYEQFEDEDVFTCPRTWIMSKIPKGVSKNRDVVDTFLKVQNCLVFINHSRYGPIYYLREDYVAEKQLPAMIHTLVQQGKRCKLAL
ncbi:MAG: hypothetical protein ACTSUE_19865 [Promethearchaeota archaeon]